MESSIPISWRSRPGTNEDSYSGRRDTRPYKLYSLRPLHRLLSSSQNPAWQTVKKHPSAGLVPSKAERFDPSCQGPAFHGLKQDKQERSSPKYGVSPINKPGWLPIRSVVTQKRSTRRTNENTLQIIRKQHASGQKVLLAPADETAGPAVS